MRSLIRAVFVAAALMLVMPTATVLAEDTQAQAQSSWTTIPIKTVPVRVMEARMRLFPRTKVTKAERNGSGSTAIYRLKMAGKPTDVKFDATGKVVK